MKVILFHVDFRSFVSLLISFFTLSKFTHSAIACEGAVYDSMQRGFRCTGRIKDLDCYRKITILKVNFSDTDLLYKEINKLQEKSNIYNESTIFRFLKNEKDSDKFYCFEAICIILSKIGYNINMNKRFTSKTILKTLKQKNYEVEFSGKPRDYIEK